MKLHILTSFLVAFIFINNAVAQNNINQTKVQSDAKNITNGKSSNYLQKKIPDKDYSNDRTQKEILIDSSTSRLDRDNSSLKNKSQQYKKHSKSQNNPRTQNNNNITNDGKGIGYRVYDNSNRQSYFCGLDQSQKKKFTHEDNFNGVYFGIGADFVSGDLSIQEKYTESLPWPYASSKINTFSHSLSGNSTVPTILIGQGRLFSNGLFLGQEMSLMIGDFIIKKENINLDAKSGLASSEINKFMLKSSNFSYYSGKFGVNFYKRFIPYVKAGLSFGEFTYISQLKNDNRSTSAGSLPTFVFGGGVDVSLAEHFRFMIDHTILSNSMDSNYTIYDSNGNSRKITADVSLNITRLNLIYKF